MGRKNTDAGVGWQRKKQAAAAAAPLGCLGGLLQLLEFHRGLRCPYFGPSTTPPSSPMISGPLPPVRVVVSKLATREDGAAEGARADTPNTPSIVARLMGLDSLPAEVPKSKSSAAVRRHADATSQAVKLQRTRSLKMDGAVAGARGPPHHRPVSRRHVLHDAANSSAPSEDCSSWPLGCSWSLPETPRSSSARRSSFDGVAEGRLSLPLYASGTGKENVDVEFERICEVISETHSSSLLRAAASPSGTGRRKSQTPPPTPSVSERPHPARDHDKSLRSVNNAVGQPNLQDKRENRGNDGDRTISRQRRAQPPIIAQEVKCCKGDSAPVVVRSLPPSYSVANEAPNLAQGSCLHLSKNNTDKTLPPTTSCHLKRLNYDKYRDTMKTPPSAAQRSEKPPEPSVRKRVIAGPKPFPGANPTSVVNPSPSTINKVTERQRPPLSLSSSATRAEAPTVFFVKEHGAANRKTRYSLFPTKQTPRTSSTWGRLAEWHYVKTILHHAGVRHGTHHSVAVKWHSPSHLIDPIVFHKLELSMVDDEDAGHHLHRPLTLGNMRHRCNRKLLFHLVDEILIELLKRTKPWCSTMCMPRHHENFSVVCGDTLLKQVWGRVQACVSSQYHLQQNVKEDVCKDTRTDMRQNGCALEEIERIVVSIERSIFNYLISELL